MNDTERYLLMYGPYKPPKARLGDKLPCEYLGIPPFVARWTDAEKALLGTETDRDVAKLLGRSQSAVETQRLHLGIPAHR